MKYQNFIHWYSSWKVWVCIRMQNFSLPVWLMHGLNGQCWDVIKIENIKWHDIWMFCVWHWMIASLSRVCIFIFCLVSVEHFYFYWFDCIYVVFLGKIDNRWLWTVFFMWHVFWGNLYYDYEQSYLCDMHSGVLYIKAFIFDNEITKIWC